MAGNLLLNPGFEDSTGDDFDDWSKVTTGSATITVETSDVYRGSQSIRFTPDGTSVCGILQYDKCEIGQEYTITFWAKGTAAGAYLNIIAPFPSPGVDFALTTDWKKYSYTGIVDSTTVYIRRSELASIPFIVDNVRVVPTPIKFAVKRMALSNDIASPDTDVTETDFGTVKAAIVIVSNAYSGGNPNDHNIFSIGFYEDSSAHRTVYSSSNDAAASSVTRRGATASKIALAQTGASVWAVYEASAITDGIRITMTTDTTSIGRYATVIMFGGADVESNISWFQMPPNDGDFKRDNTIGFRPDLLLVAGVGYNAASSSYNVMSVGAITRYDLANRAVYWGDADSDDTTNCSCWAKTTHSTAQVTATSIGWQGKVTKFTSDGYIIEADTGATGGDYIMVLALKIPGVQLKLDTFTGATSTGNDATTGVGFKPGFLMIANTHATATDTKTDGISCGLGAGTLSEEWSTCVGSEDAVDTSDTWSACEAAIVNLKQSGDKDTDHSVATVSSFDSDGFTLNYSAADAVTKGWYLAFADTTQNRKTFIQGV